MNEKTFNPGDYTTGSDRYIRFIEDFLDITPVGLQKKILRTVAENQRTLIWGANGPGKSFITAALKLAYLYTNINSIVMGTSGSYQQYHDTMWRPLETMHSRAKRKHGLPGRTIGGEKGARLEIDDEWYAKTISPRSPGELEGRHGPNVMVVIDEADKKFITEKHFDSGGSSITDLDDKLVAVCNPPEDETDVVYRKKHSDRWEVVEFSSFEAHNIQVDVGEVDGDRIPGIVDLITLASDWEDWNGEHWPMVEESYSGQWPGMPVIEDLIEKKRIDRERALKWLRPGFSVVKRSHETRRDLDERWYKRRVGQIPPDTASVHRPIYVDQVQNAKAQNLSVGRNRYGIGVDIGRTGDSTVVIEVRQIEGTDGHGLYIATDREGMREHSDNESICRGSFEDGPLFGPAAVDATGEGSGVADQMAREYEFATRFDAGMKPVDPRRQREYKDRRTEALALLGQFLADGGKFSHTRLEKELFAAARAIKFNRARSGGRDVFKATSKDAIKKRIGRSPDFLDAAAIAVWCFNEAHEKTIRGVSEKERKSIPSTW